MLVNIFSFFLKMKITIGLIIIIFQYYPARAICGNVMILTRGLVLKAGLDTFPSPRVAISNKDSVRATACPYMLLTSVMVIFTRQMFSLFAERVVKFNLTTASG